MGQVRASGTIKNLNLIGCTRMANQRSEADIYHVFFVWVGAGAPWLPVNRIGLWPISANHWLDSCTLAPVEPFLRAPDSAVMKRCLRSPQGAISANFRVLVFSAVSCVQEITTLLPRERADFLKFALIRLRKNRTMLSS